MTFNTNIRRGSRTRIPPRVGDVFGMHIPRKGWLFGRVIRTDANGAGLDPCHLAPSDVLIYVYGNIQRDPTPIPRLDKHDLLVPPLMTRPHGWKDGYFQTLETRALAPEDVLEQHCFENWVAGGYIDEYQKVLFERTEPCGTAGVLNLKGVDDEISKALGIPLAGDQDGAPSSAEELQTAKDGLGEVAIHVPVKRREESIALEHVLRAMIEAQEAGKWKGHGFDLARGVFDARFESPSWKKLLTTLRAAAGGMKLPSGSFIMLRRGKHGDAQRIDL